MAVARDHAAGPVDDGRRASADCDPGAADLGRPSPSAVRRAPTPVLPRSRPWTPSPTNGRDRSGPTGRGRAWLARAGARERPIATAGPWDRRTANPCWCSTTPTTPPAPTRPRSPVATAGPGAPADRRRLRAHRWQPQRLRDSLHQSLPDPHRAAACRDEVPAGPAAVRSTPLTISRRQPGQRRRAAVVNDAA